MDGKGCCLKKDNFMLQIYFIMKKILFAALVCCSLSLLAFVKIDGLKIGDALPLASQQLKDVSGKQVTMAETKKENGLLVMFSCNTCPYVVKYQERAKAISEYALKNNIGVIVLNSNEAKRSDDDSFVAMKAYYDAQGYAWSYAVDENSAVADAFGANRTPECFLFNKDLKLSYHGGIDDNANSASAVTQKHLQTAIDEMVAGKEITKKESRSVGCTIKRKG
jgi:hypothetical protein